MLDFLYSLIGILGQSTGPLHLIGKASYVVTTFNRYHHGISSFIGLTQKVSIF
jgi:hypothetical protein